MDLTAGTAKPTTQAKVETTTKNSRNSSSVYRKSVKPLIEKRRRARINASLEQLKKLLQHPPDQQSSRAISRLEKAKILEMAVQQLSSFKKQGAIAASHFQESPDFVAGYCHCMDTVSTFLNSAGSRLAQDMKSEILQHMEANLKARSTAAAASVSKVNQPQKADCLTSPQSSFLWASIPGLARPSLSDPHLLPAWSQLQLPPTSVLSPQLRASWTSPASPAITSQIWRPW